VSQKPIRSAPAKNENEFANFTRLVDRVLSVPHSVVKERIEEHRKAAAQNPNRRGPKPKKPS